ncbi:hypothetical protein PRIC1_011758 [Phytophthora ramorum]
MEPGSSVELALQVARQTVYRKYEAAATTAAVATPMAPATVEAPLEPEALALAAVEPDVVLLASVVDDEDVTPEEPDDSVVLEPTVPADPVVLVAPTVESTAPEAAVVAAPEAAVVAASAPEAAVEATADVTAADPAVEAAVLAWPFTAATARAAMTRTWKNFMVLVEIGRGLGHLEVKVRMNKANRAALAIVVTWRDHGAVRMACEPTVFPGVVGQAFHAGFAFRRVELGFGAM